MGRRAIGVCFLFGVLIFSSGCLALLAGAGGTALWQAGKVISEESVSMARGALATEKAFSAEKITLTDKVVKNKVTQLRGEDQLNKKVSVDVLDKGPNNVRIEVRYGFGEEIPARNLLETIKGYL